MPDYNQTNIAGSKWQRAARVVVENQFQQTPNIVFVEEEVMVADTGDLLMARQCGNIATAFDPQATFQEINADGTPGSRTFTHADVYTVLNSLYRHLAAIRDSQTV